MPTPPPPTAISFARRDAQRGMFWLGHAYAMFRAAPLRWMMLIVAYYLIVLCTALGPWPIISTLATWILKPVFAVGFLAAAWGQERGNKPAFADLFRGFRSNLWALLPLGLVLFSGMALAVAATTLVDGGALIAWGSGGDEPNQEVLASGRPQLALLVGLACALPTLLALWFAPALVVFHNASALTALATSLRAALTNWRPVTIFGLGFLFYAGVVPALGSQLVRLLDTTPTTLLGLGLFLPYALIILATFQIADYVAYRDVFHPDEPMPAASDQAG